MGVRLLLIGGGLLILWLAIQFMPAPSAPPPVASDEAGTVATTPNTASKSGSLTIFTPGRIAVIVLLLGGGALALYLRQRSSANGEAAALIQTLGQVQISQDQHLRLVCCNDEVLLLGVTSNEITLLKSYPRSSFDLATPPDDDLAEPGQPAAPVSQSPTFSKFADVLRQYGHFSSHE